MVVSAPEFSSIYQAEASYVWRSLRRLGVRDRDLEDLVHDVFVKVYRRLDDYDSERPLRPWLFGFAFRVASDYRRRAGHQRETVAPPVERPDEARLPDEQVAQRQARRLLQRALDTLNIDRRAVIIMHDIDGFTAPEIADALALPLNTVYSRLRIARGELAAAVRRTGLTRGAA